MLDWMGCKRLQLNKTQFEKKIYDNTHITLLHEGYNLRRGSCSLFQFHFNLV